MTGRVLFWLFLIFTTYSCSEYHSNYSFKVQAVKGSSNLLTCDKMFGEDLGALEEKNEILLQIGSIDTTNEHFPIPSAIIHINNEEIVLNFLSTSSSGNSVTEIYSGNG